MVLLSEHIYQYKTGRPDLKIKVREVNSIDSIPSPCDASLD
jgi:hypothetical protein